MSELILLSRGIVRDVSKLRVLHVVEEQNLLHQLSRHTVQDQSNIQSVLQNMHRH